MDPELPDNELDTNSDDDQLACYSNPLVRSNKFLHPKVKEVIAQLCFWLTPETIAAYLDLHPRTVKRVWKLYQETGTVVTERDPDTIGRPQTLDWTHGLYLQRLLEFQPDLKRIEIQERLLEKFGLWVSLSTISRVLEREGQTFKRLSKRAAERDEEKRMFFFDYIMEHYTPEQLVFVDESAVDKRTSIRKDGWAPKGERARYKVPFHHGKKYSILPALSLEGVLCVSIIEGSVDHVIFHAFISELLENMNPYPGTNSVIIMDNASIHKNEILMEMVVERGMRIAYLPAYSPDLNPIKEGFSAMKAWIRSNGKAVRSALGGSEAKAHRMLRRAVYQSMTPAKARGWFDHSGYMSAN